MEWPMLTTRISHTLRRPEKVFWLASRVNESQNSALDIGR